MVTSHLLRLAGAWLFALFAAAPVMAASSGFIAADGRTDIAYDTARQVLYISGGAQLRRYDMAAQAFLSPIALGGTTMGMDISADGRFLAVANGSRDAKANFVDIIAPKSAKITVDGAPVNNLTPIGTTNFSLAHVKLVNNADGNHTVAGDLKFGVGIYGVLDYGSYWYPGGLDLAFIPPN